MNALGQPWVRISGMPPRRTWTKCTRTPSTSAMNCGERFSARSRARQSNPSRPVRAQSLQVGQVGALRPGSPGAAAASACAQPLAQIVEHVLADVDRERLDVHGGHSTDVLAPIVGPDLQVLFVGINPSLRSAEVGHNFARPGNRFYPALHAAGFTPRLLAPEEDGDAAALRRRHHEHRRPPDPRRRRAQPRGAARGRRRAGGARRERPAAPGRDARPDRLPHRVRPPQGDDGPAGGDDRRPPGLDPPEPERPQRPLQARRLRPPLRRSARVRAR